MEKYFPGYLHNFRAPTLKCKLYYLITSPWILLKQGTRNGNRGTFMGKQKGEGETTQRMGNKVTDRARAKAKFGSHFSFSHFRVRSLFLIPRWVERSEDRKYVCVRRLVPSRSLAAFHRGSSRHLIKR